MSPIWADAQTLITMLGLAITQSGTFAAPYEIVNERATFRRERAVNLHVGAYVLAEFLVLGVLAVVQAASVLLILGLRVDMDFDGFIISTGVLELLVTLLIAVIASIMFGLFISAIAPTTHVVLYAILIQFFAQIILSGSVFPLESNLASKATVANWTMDAIGSTIDLISLNEESRVCTVTGDPSEPVRCDKAQVDTSLDREHSQEPLLGMWGGLLGHALFWGALTVIVQVRKKTE